MKTLKNVLVIGSIYLVSGIVMAQMFSPYKVRWENDVKIVSFEQRSLIKIRQCDKAIPYSTIWATGDHKYEQRVNPGQLLEGRHSNGSWGVLSDATNCK